MKIPGLKAPAGWCAGYTNVCSGKIAAAPDETFAEGAEALPPSAARPRRTIRSMSEDVRIPTTNGLRPIDHEPQLPRLMVHALIGGAFTGRRQGLLHGAVRLLDKALLAYDAARV